LFGIPPIKSQNDHDILKTWGAWPPSYAYVHTAIINLKANVDSIADNTKTSSSFEACEKSSCLVLLSYFCDDSNLDASIFQL